MAAQCNYAELEHYSYSREYASTLLCNTGESIPLELRLVFDIGSGGTKFMLGIIDIQNRKIVKILQEGGIVMPYQKCISESPNGKTLTKECMDQGLASLMKIVSIYGTKDIKLLNNAGIATAWARNAENINEYLSILKTHGFNIVVLSQQAEGEIGYKAAESHYMPCAGENRMAVVWDIGGGSYQLSAKEKDGSIYVHHGKYGSSNFNKKVKQYIAKKYDIPEGKLWSERELKAAEEFAKKEVTDQISQDKHLLDLMVDKCVDFVAIGQFMNLGVKPLVGNSDFIVEHKIDKVLESTYDKTLGEAAKLFPSRSVDFLPVIQSDLILAKAIMHGIGKENFTVLNAKSVDYVATDKSFWPTTTFPLGNDSYFTAGEINCLHDHTLMDEWALIIYG